MQEPANREAGDTRRLILGFDGGCATCSDLAERISEQAGTRLEVRSLHHPQVEHWRERALGKDAPWAPTLFQIGGVRGVRAWTGPGMALRLARALGPVATWRLMQVLGEAGKASTPVDGMSRGHFLKGFGGGALGVVILSASGGWASPALAAKNELNEEGLAEAFSMIEQIPDSVAARGERAAKEWLEARVQASASEGRGIWSCARSVAIAILANGIPVLKLRKAIKALGGGYRFARFIVRTYQRTRSLRKTARITANRVLKITGEDVFGALLALFSLEGVKRNCF
jgi:predicted DCC family thiol-disulfide oxidoreductase YuxK